MHDCIKNMGDFGCEAQGIRELDLPSYSYFAACAGIANISGGTRILTKHITMAAFSKVLLYVLTNPTHRK